MLYTITIVSFAHLMALVLLYVANVSHVDNANVPFFQFFF